MTSSSSTPSARPANMIFERLPVEGPLRGACQEPQ
eukprot:CAMPEP_0196736978 /NCGR_PEP_ID=MMETSP1091-20130531/14855_1 /TAXON_ID=302021 /ORGANISM="Rhodomonas sp., Strain CCMP768" /LENGTH=34 /DNA_ID= /DNA_START= /DNA_END= /DNA_ORIENTATION=